MKTPILVLALGSALVLSACGGGGGGGGSGSGTVGSGGGTTTPPVTTTPPASTLSTITSANMTAAASNAFAATTSVGASSASLTDILTGVSVSSGGINTVAPVLRLIKHTRDAGQFLTGVTKTTACAGGGTVTIDASQSTANTFSNGDTMTVTAASCVENGETVSGALSIKFSGITGQILSGAAFGATLDSTFTNFNITSGTDKVGVNGDMKIVLNQTSATASTIALTGNSLQTTEQQGTAAVVSRVITGYTVKGTTLNNTTTSAADFGLSGTSNSLGQFSFTVKNVAPFVSTGTAAPVSGALIVNGNASSVTATAVSTGVRIDFSAKGDGTITSSNTLTWASFLATI